MHSMDEFIQRLTEKAGNDTPASLESNLADIENTGSSKEGLNEVKSGISFKGGLGACNVKCITYKLAGASDINALKRRL